MLNIAVSSILSFLVTFFAIPVIIQVAKEKKLFDEPGERKIHKVVIPTLGGLGIFAGFIFSLFLCLPSSFAADFQFYAAAFIVIFFLGMKDDVLILSVSKKFIGQVIAAVIIVKFAGLRITNMYGFLGIHDIPYSLSIILSIFTIIVITNSFNLIDGIDGLAGSLGLLTMVIFGAYFLLNSEWADATIAFTMAGSLLGFLIFNISPAKIFMGDTGSLLLGLVNAIMAIKFINLAGSTSLEFSLQASPAIAIAILIVPLFDTLRVFALRISSGRSPFSPDRNHIHHIMLDLGLSHRQVTAACVLANIGIVGMTYSLRYLGTNWALVFVLLSCLLLTGFMYIIRQKTRAPQTQREKELIKAPKILSFASEPMEVE